MSFPSSVIACTSCVFFVCLLFIELREVIPLCVCLCFMYLCFICLCFMCLCFMGLCFGVYKLGELHFHRITRGNQVTTGIHRPLSLSHSLQTSHSSFLTWINPALYVWYIFTLYHFTSESNSSSPSIVQSMTYWFS